MSSEARDESAEKDESTQQKEHYETKSDDPPIEFKDQVYKLMQGVIIIVYLLYIYMILLIQISRYLIG